jgi:PAS domain S-box-containing protein
MGKKQSYEDLLKRIQQLERNVEQYKRSQLKLQESESRFKDIANNAQEWIWEVDPTGKYTYSSPVVKKILNYDPSEVLGKYFFDFFHPEEKERLTQVAFKVFKHKKSFRRFINRNICKDGRTVIISTSGTPVLDEDGILIGYRGSDTDITDQIKAEKELRKSEEHMRSLLESAKGFSLYQLVFDETSPLSLKVVTASPSIKYILGIPDPMNLEAWFEAIHPDDLNRVIRAHQQAFDTFLFDEEYRTFNQEKNDWRWVHTISTGGRDANGWNKYVNGIIMDIDERKRYQLELEIKDKELNTKYTELKNTQEKLCESNKHIQSLMNNASGFVIYRLAYNKDDPYNLTPVFVSPSVKDLLGIDPEEFTSENFFHHIHPDDVARVKEANQLAFESNRFDIICRFYNAIKDRWIWIHTISTGVRNAENQVTHVNGIVIDITEKQEATEKLKINEKELMDKARELGKMNAALNFLLEKREKDKIDLQNRIAANIKQLIFPYLTKIREGNIGGDQLELLDIIKSNLNEITAKFSYQLSSRHIGLTPTEISIADLVRQGHRSKEIAQLLHLSPKTVETHREKIREKLGIKNKKINLQSFLASMK